MPSPENQTTPWRVVRLRAVATEDEGWRKAGGELWKERWPLAELEKIKNSDLETWLTSYQQEPCLKGGYFFSDIPLNFYEEVRWSDFNRYLLCDPALSKHSKADYTAILVVGLGGDRNFYLLDCVRARLDPRERADWIFRLHRKWRPTAVGYEEYGLMSDIVTLRERQESENYRFVITELGRSGEWHQLSKQDRIRTLIPLGATGRIWLPNPETRGRDAGTVTWVKYFVENEWAKFPASKHDDLLDILSRINDPDLRVDFPSDKPFELPASTRRPGASFMSL